MYGRCERLEIYVDLDATLNRLQDAWLSAIKERLGEDMSVHDINSWDVLSDRRYQDLLDLPGLFRSLDVEPDAQQALSVLHDEGHEIFVVSASRPSAYVDKQAWLNDLFPFITSDRIMFVTRKDRLAAPGRILIDDGAHNVIDWRECGGTGIIFDQPWNIEVDGDRLYGWRFLIDQLRSGDYSRSDDD